jgi:hypothetical protein
MSETTDARDSTLGLAAYLLEFCAQAGPGRSVAPMDVAQAYSQLRGDDPLAWRRHLTDLRAHAVKLADAGRLVIYRKGKPVDPHDFRGVYRLGAPRSE